MADEAKLAAMRQRFVARANEQAARLAELRGGLAGTAMLAPEARDEIRRLCHSLHGAGGTFGFQDISEAAAAAEDLGDELAAEGADAALNVELDAALGQLLALIAAIG